MNQVLTKQLYSESYKSFYDKAIVKLKNIIHQIDIKYTKENFIFENFLALKNYNGSSKLDILIKNIEKFKNKDIDDELKLELQTDELVDNLKLIDQFKELPDLHKEISIKINEEDHYNQVILKKELEKYLNKVIKKIVLKIFISSSIYRKNHISDINKIINKINSIEDLEKLFNILLELYSKLNEDLLISEKEISTLEFFQEKIEEKYKKEIKDLSEENISKLESKLNKEIMLNIKITSNSTNIQKLYEELFEMEALESYKNIFYTFFEGVN